MSGIGVCNRRVYSHQSRTLTSVDLSRSVRTGKRIPQVLVRAQWNCKKRLVQIVFRPKGRPSDVFCQEDALTIILKDNERVSESALSSVIEFAIIFL